MARVAGLRDQARWRRRGSRICCERSSAGRRNSASTCRTRPTPPTPTASRDRTSRASPASAPSNGASRASCAGTPWRWSSAPTAARSGIGGHISTFASAATLYEVGFNHFFHGRDHQDGGDQIYFQGHASPGIYARAFLEGPSVRGTTRELPPRAESRDGGLPSYPHPRSMPGLLGIPHRLDGPRAAHGDLPGALQPLPRGPRADPRPGPDNVWAFLGDGETDEPESLGSISLAAREGLDNLTFVVNCNLQRLDGPVRGNGKIIQELEAGHFRGAGWNVIKVIWGDSWDPIAGAGFR